MKSLSDEERQRGFVEFELVTTSGEELDFSRQEFLGNLQLVFVAQALKHRAAPEPTTSRRVEPVTLDEKEFQRCRRRSR